MDERLLQAHLKRQRRNVMLLSIIFHTLVVVICFFLGMGGGWWMVFFVPASTMTIRGVRTTRGIYKLFSDPTKAQKYYSQARS